MIQRTPSLHVTRLGLMRGESRLFSHVDFSAQAGQILFLRGSNGSGKTSLLRCLAGLIEPDAGEIQRNGELHWIGHSSGIKPHETPRTHLKHWARVFGGNMDFDQIIAKAGLSRAANVPATGLSAGQKRRTALARLSLQRRGIWLLDEPFSALDIAGRDWVAGLMQTQGDNGGIVIAAVHGDVPLIPDHEVTL